MRFVPTNAAYLTIGGGFWMIIGSFAFTFDGSHWPGIAWGLGTLVLGLAMILYPDNMGVWAWFAIVLAVGSLLVALGGFLVGFVLALLGGMYARRYKIPDVGGPVPGTMVRVPTPAWPDSGPSPPPSLPPPPSPSPTPSQDTVTRMVAPPPLRAIHCPTCGRLAVYVAPESRYYCEFDQTFV